MGAEKRNSFHPDDFLTRAEKISKMKIPHSSRKVVIVKPNNEGIGFKFNCYAPEYLSPHIDKVTFDKTVKNCHKICEAAYIQKKTEEEAEYSAPYKKILLVGALFILISLILLMVRVYGTVDTNLVIVALALVGVTVVATLLVVIKMYLTSPDFINLELVTKTRIAAALEQENKMYYRQKGFEWKMEPSYYWLELHQVEDHKDGTPRIMKTIRVSTESDDLYQSPPTEM